MLLEQFKKELQIIIHEKIGAGHELHAYLTGKEHVLRRVINELETQRKENSTMQPPINGQLVAIVNRFLTNTPMQIDYAVYEDAKKLLDYISEVGVSVTPINGELVDMIKLLMKAIHPNSILYGHAKDLIDKSGVSVTPPPVGPSEIISDLIKKFLSECDFNKDISGLLDSVDEWVMSNPVPSWHYPAIDWLKKMLDNFEVSSTDELRFVTSLITRLQNEIKEKTK